MTSEDYKKERDKSMKEERSDAIYFAVQMVKL